MLAVFCFNLTMTAQDRDRRSRLSKEEFKVELERYLTEKASLSKEEATKFFPIYSECQDAKRKLNDQIWALRKKACNGNLSENDYKAILLA